MKPSLAGRDEERGYSIAVKEIAHLPSVKAYHDRDIDRDPATLIEGIFALSNGKVLGDAWREVEAPHYQAHGMPGGWLPKLRAALAKLKKETPSESV